MVVHGVGARHAQQRVLAEPARLAEEVVRRERARDVALDHRLEWTLLGKYRRTWKLFGPTPPLFIINFFAGSMTVKFILRDFVDLHCLGAFLVVATDDFGFQELQWFGKNEVDLVNSRKSPAACA